MNLVRGEGGYLLYNPTVGGALLAEIGRIEQVQNARLTAAGNQARARAGDQHRTGTREVRISGVHSTPVAGRERVDQLQTVGGIEFQCAFIEVVKAVVDAGEPVAHEYVDVARAVDDRRAPGLPHPTTTPGGHRREDAALSQGHLVVRHHPPDVADGGNAGILVF